MSAGAPSVELTEEKELALTLEASMNTVMEEKAVWIASLLFDDGPGIFIVSWTLFIYPAKSLCYFCHDSFSYMGTSFGRAEWDCQRGFYRCGKAACSNYGDIGSRARR